MAATAQKDATGSRERYGVMKKREDDIPTDSATIARQTWDRYAYCRDRGHSSYIATARRLEEYYLGGGRQWTAEDRAEVRASGRPVVEINEILPAVSTAIGDQLKSRADITFRPRNNETDQQTADTLTKVCRQVCDANQYPWLESQIWADGLIQQRGFLEIWVDFTHNALGEIKMIDLDPLDVLIDPASNRYDPESWGDVMVVKWMTVDEIEQLFGAKANEVAQRTLDGEGLDDIQLRNSFGDDSDGKSGHYSGSTWRGGLEDRFVRHMVVYRQHRRYEMSKVLITQDGQIELADGYTPEEIADTVSQGGALDRRAMLRIRWTVATADVLLHDEWSPYRSFTIVPFFPYFRRGKTIGMIDNATSPQDLLNKSASQFLHIVNSASNSGWKVEDGSLADMTPDELAAQGSKTGLVVRYKKGSTPPEKILPNPVPQGTDRMIERAELFIRTITGMSEAMQGMQGNEVSGVAVQSRQYQGKTQLGGPIDNLARTRNFTANKIKELIQDFYTEQRVFLITDQSDPSQTKYERIVVNERMGDGRIHNHLAVGEYDVVISDQPQMATFSDNQFRQAMDMRKEGVGIPDTFIVESSSLTKKQDIIKAMGNQNVDPEKEAKAKEIEAHIRSMDATTKRIEVETVNEAVEAQYSAMQAANVVATTPQTAPVADALLLSAGFVDRDSPPIVPSYQGEAVAQLAGMPKNTNPLTPANPGVGLNQGIETPQNDLGGPTTT